MFYLQWKAKEKKKFPVDPSIKCDGTGMLQGEKPLGDIRIQLT